MRRIALSDESLFWLCLLAALICLAGSLALAGSSWGLMIAPAMLGAWAAGRRFAWRWLAGTFLCVYTASAAGALLTGGSFHLLAAGMSLALAAFELAGGQTPAMSVTSEASEASEANLNARFEEQLHRRWLVLLGMAVGLGFAAAEAGRLLSWPVPFGGLGLAALGVLYGLVKLFGLLKRGEG